MYLKGLVTAAFGSSEPFYFGKWAAPSLHRESTDSLIYFKGIVIMGVPVVSLNRVYQL